MVFVMTLRFCGIKTRLIIRKISLFKIAHIKIYQKEIAVIESKEKLTRASERAGTETVQVF